MTPDTTLRHLRLARAWMLCSLPLLIAFEIWILLVGGADLNDATSLRTRVAFQFVSACALMTAMVVVPISIRFTRQLGGIHSAAGRFVGIGGAAGCAWVVAAVTWGIHRADQAQVYTSTPTIEILYLIVSLLLAASVVCSAQIVMLGWRDLARRAWLPLGIGIGAYLALSQSGLALMKGRHLTGTELQIASITVSIELAVAGICILIAARSRLLSGGSFFRPTIILCLAVLSLAVADTSFFAAQARALSMTAPLYVLSQVGLIVMSMSITASVLGYIRAGT